MNIVFLLLMENLPYYLSSVVDLIISSKVLVLLVDTYKEQKRRKMKSRGLKYILLIFNLLFLWSIGIVTCKNDINLHLSCLRSYES